MPKSCMRIAAEHVQLVGCVVIDADVERVVVELDSSGGCEIRLIQTPHSYWLHGISFKQIVRLGRKTGRRV